MSDVQSLGVERQGSMRLFALPGEPVAEGEFAVHTLWSGLSAGTELSFLKGSNPYLVSCWDEELCVFRDGAPSNRLPVRVLGYMEVGTVEESRRDDVRAGDLVAMAYGHKTAHTARAGDFFVPLPADLDPLLGIYVAQMGPICANGVLHAAAALTGPAAEHLGDGVRDRCVLVTGAGVVGLLTGLFARHHGAAAVAVADPSPARLDAAEGLGLEPVDTRDVEAWRHCKERWRHGANDCGADVAFQCRGQAAALGAALRSLRPQGAVIDLAFYQGGASDVRLGEEFHHNGLSIHCAQIARVPRPLAGAWDRRRLANESIDLLRAHGKAVTEHLVTDVVALHDAPEFVADVAGRRRQTIQAVFDFRSPTPDAAER
jgi:NADPH:quinone reductase-like Zn-dependent oxidoreductase